MAFGEEEYGVGGLVRSTSFGRNKRVAFTANEVDIGSGSQNDDGKRLCVADKSAIENLPEEVLIRILCGVEHDDLKKLFFVSKTIREATLIAKQSHFAYSTPKKTVVGFKNSDDLDEVEPPNAPKQSRVRLSRLSAKKLGEISVSLFASLGKK